MSPLPPPEPGPAGPAGEARERLRAALLDCGFTLCGFARPAVDPAAGVRFRAWFEAGYGGGMDWLGRSLAERIDPRVRLPWARTAIVFGLAYDQAEGEGGAGVLHRISRYARGRAYQNLLRGRLRAAGKVLAAGGGTQWQGWADTGPVAERELALAGGLGWRGRNSLVLHPDWGSYLFLAVGFSDLELPPDSPMADHCGSCRACVEACPTGALVADGLLDARRCISYLNIEHRGDFAAPYDAGLHGWLHGCDLCQECCPFVQAARRRGRTGDPAFAPAPRWQDLELADLAGADEVSWDQWTRGSSLRRGGLERLHRISRRLLAGASADEA